MSLRETLISTADEYCAVSGVTLSRVGISVANDGNFFRRLKKGGDCATKTFERAMEWFADYWPSDAHRPATLDQYASHRAKKGIAR